MKIFGHTKTMNKKHLTIGKQVIDLEILALKNLKKYLGKSFTDSVKAIMECQSKVIVCGVGKSGLIGAKISSTFSSVGIPSFFLSATGSSHGDLGVISKKDLLILISNSGETIELKNIINFCNKNRVKLIGITSKKNSLLFNNSDIGILMPKVKEAGLGIVPTSSTTSQLALGDALAVSVMLYKKFKISDFKKYHPSGNLGKRLRLVKDLMLSNNKIPFINENQKFNNVIKIIKTKKLGVAIIRNNKNQTTGIITDGDLKRIIQVNKGLENLKIKNFMKKNPISINKNDLAAKAIAIMNKRKITSLCVHENANTKKTIGILHIHTLISQDI